MNYAEAVDALSAAEDELVQHLLSSVEKPTPADTIRAGLIAFGLYDTIDMPYADTDYMNDPELMEALHNLTEWFPNAPLEKTVELVSRYMAYVLLEFSLGQDVPCDATWTEVSVALSTIFRRKISYQYEVSGLTGEEEGAEEEYEEEDTEEEAEEAETTGTVQTMIDGRAI